MLIDKSDKSDDPINLSNIYQNAYSISAIFIDSRIGMDTYRKVSHYCRLSK